MSRCPPSMSMVSMTVNCGRGRGGMAPNSPISAASRCCGLAASARAGCASRPGASVVATPADRAERRENK
ncbi:hypothetical protein JMG10_32810 [Nostoc ellipsosporum NOK]|nr:hypothetical protein [Nostoc ellipsosporum NOK]